MLRVRRLTSRPHLRGQTLPGSTVATRTPSMRRLIHSCECGRGGGPLSFTVHGRLAATLPGPRFPWYGTTLLAAGPSSLAVLAGPGLMLPGPLVPSANCLHKLVAFIALMSPPWKPPRFLCGGGGRAEWPRGWRAARGRWLWHAPWGTPRGGVVRRSPSGGVAGLGGRRCGVPPPAFRGRSMHRPVGGPGFRGPSSPSSCPRCACGSRSLAADFPRTALGEAPAPQGGLHQSCTCTFHCSKCKATSPLSSLSADARGHLRPTRCKHCGHAVRPNSALCQVCGSTWHTCRSRPAAMQTSATLSGVEGLHTWCFSFATDFSGMDMTSCALDSTLFGSLAATQAWASDIWGPAKDFLPHQPPS